MSERWYTAAEIAGLPGLPGTERGINKAGDRGELLRRKRSTGKGWHYAMSSLPTEARMALVAREVIPTSTAADTSDSAALSVPAHQVTDDQRAVMTARICLVRMILDNANHQGYRGTTTASAEMAQMLRVNPHQHLRQLAIRANDRARAGYVISARTLQRWVHAWQTHGDAGLIPGRRQRRLEIPAWASSFLGYYQRPTQPSVADAYRDFVRSLNGATAPSIHQVRRFLGTLSVETRERGRMGPREIIKKLPFKRRKFSDLLPNDIWTADGHTFDAEVQHPFYVGKVFRPEITTYLDIRTRRIVGWSVDLAESAIAVLDGLRSGIRESGLCAVLYTDNGKGYVNDAVSGALERLGITLTTSLPYRSQARGAIERIHSTVWVPLAKRLPTYIGADMDREAGTRMHKLTRKDLAQRGNSCALVSWEQFIELCEQAVTDYNGSAHSSLHGHTPDAVWESYTANGWQPQGIDADMLDMEIRPRITRTLQRGEVRLFNRRYFARELGAFDAGTEVQIGYDVRDDSRVWVHDMAGRLLAIAERDGNATPYMPGSFVADARARREQQQVKRLAEKIEARSGQRVTHIELEHQPGVTLDNLLRPELQRQPDAIPAEDTDTLNANQVKVVELMRESEITRETDERRIHADWLRVQARIEAGDESVTEPERDGLTIYKRGQAYTAMTRFFEAFDLSADDFPPREADKRKPGMNRAEMQK